MFAHEQKNFDYVIEVQQAYLDGRLNKNLWLRTISNPGKETKAFDLDEQNRILRILPARTNPTKELEFVNVGAFEKRLQERDVRHALERYAGISADRSVSSIIDQFINGPRSHLLNGIAYGFPLADVVSYHLEIANEKRTPEPEFKVGDILSRPKFAYHRKDRLSGGFESTDSDWEAFAFVTYGDQTREERAILKAKSDEIERIRDRAIQSGVSYVELFNNWHLYEVKFSSENCVEMIAEGLG